MENINNVPEKKLEPATLHSNGMLLISCLLCILLGVSIGYAVARVGDTPLNNNTAAPTNQNVVTNEPPPDTNLLTYENKFYDFSVKYPKDFKMCLNDFCQNTVADTSIQYVNILENQQREVQIRPLGNELGMTAVQFAERSLAANRKYDTDGRTQYRDEKIGTFADEISFEFVAIGGFEERGLQMGDWAREGRSVARVEPNLVKAGEGFVISESHKVIYFDHAGVMYRITYPVNSLAAQKIVESFSFFVK